MNWLNVTISPLLNKIISSGIVLLIVFALRMIVVRGLVKREGLTPTIRRRWMIATRNGAFFLVLAGLVFVWFEQLRTLAATAVVVAAAIVIATKELVKADSDWQQAEEVLLKAANEVCTRYIDEARKHMQHLSTRHSLDAPRVEPKVHIHHNQRSSILSCAFPFQPGAGAGRSSRFCGVIC